MPCRFSPPLAALVLMALTAAAPAQTVEERLGAMQSQIDRLNQRLAERASEESTLRKRVVELEHALETEKSQNRDRLEELQDRYDGVAQETELDRLIGNIQQANRYRPVGRSPLTLGGYFDVEYRDDDAQRNSTFDQHRLILQMGAQILPDAISFRSEIEIEGGGADASFLTGNEIVVEFAELHFNFHNAFNVKAGVLLVPFGRFNYLHDSPLRDLTDRPLVARRIIPTTWADAGIGVYGFWSMFGIDFDYDVILGNGLDDDFSTTPGGGFRGARNSFRADNNDNKMVIGRLGADPDIPFLDSVYLGASFGFGQYDNDDDQQIWMFGIDWTIKKGPFELIGEYASIDLERSAAEIAAGVPGGADGFYIQLNFHFFPESWRGATKFFTNESTFTLVFRYGTIDTDDSTRGIDRDLRGAGFRDDLERYTVGINFRPIEKTVFKIEYQFFDETGSINEAGNNRFVMSFATYF